ncbi:MAG: DUF1365 domain-containing protein [Vampirovibrionales bacterium]|nr:DUF1365 domain-containing protein [Vampirovibrionales bacterium]
MLQNSIYRAQVMHQRLHPKRYGFQHQVFFVCLNLNTLSELDHDIAWFGVNRRSLYCFDERDHLASQASTLLPNVRQAAKESGYEALPEDPIFFIGQVRFLGYVFNPVSFFVFCNRDAQPQFMLAQVENTFYERKLYPIAKSDNNTFEAMHPKLFYVSPYSELQDAFHFNLQFTPHGLDFKIDTERVIEPDCARLQKADGNRYQKILISRMHGCCEPLEPNSFKRLTKEFPFLAWQIIGLIHWHALRLFQLGLGVHRKEESPHLQQGIISSIRPTSK